MALTEGFGKGIFRLGGLVNFTGGSLQVRPDEFPDAMIDITPCHKDEEQSIILGGGCFWCVEAVFKPLDGVLTVVSGYAGDTAENADYGIVSTGNTNHAEVIEIRFDPNRISYGELLKIFFSVAHDPTQVNRQGPDVGSQYRSAIFYANDDQKRVAECYIRQLEKAGVYATPIVTRLEPLVAFYGAEAYHQDYARQNPNNPYIAVHATPKVDKLHTFFEDRIKVK